MSQDNIEAGASDSKHRQSTPDIIKDNNRKVISNEDSDTKPVNGDNTDTTAHEAVENSEAKETKKIITSEEEAKARIAEKRREMKEQKEREAELERLRLEEEARRAEEERIRKAIEEKEAEDRKKREEEEKLRAEKEEAEKKMKAEAERREAELQEKLKKEEEERLARKKRIEEIMARTRGKGAATPKKDETADQGGVSQPPAPAPQQPPSLDTNVDPTKPDLLGDINNERVEENNAKNLAHNGSSPSSSQSPAEADMEKGALDSISSKSDENDNSR